jgi:hypothetical protein
MIWRIHMYARVTKSGVRSYLQLVESYRVEGGGVRQRVIANFGRLDHPEPKDLEPLIPRSSAWSLSN